MGECRVFLARQTETTFLKENVNMVPLTAQRNYLTKVCR